MIDYTVNVPLEILDGKGYDTLSSSDIKKVIQYNIRSTLLTCKGERPYQPNFGFCMRKYLFELPTKKLLSTMRTKITKQLREYVNYISIRQLNIFISPKNPNSLKITIKYIISEVKIEDIFEMDVDLLI